MQPRYLLPALLALVACHTETPPPSQAPAHSSSSTGTTTLTMPSDTEGAPRADTVHLRSLLGTGLKFNGVYDHNEGNIHYFMRFFQRGNVVLIAGRQPADGSMDLRTLLKEDAQGGTGSLHNAPVTFRNDSLYFTTMANRGAITYAGAVHGDSLRFIKHSRATGKRAVISYGFIPDRADSR